MSTRYIIKKCNSFGFATDITEAHRSFKSSLNEKCSNEYVLHLTSNDPSVDHSILEQSSPVHRIYKMSELKQFVESDKFKEMNSNGTVFKLYVDLGYITASTEEIPVEYDDSEIIRIEH